MARGADAGLESAALGASAPKIRAPSRPSRIVLDASPGGLPASRRAMTRSPFLVWLCCALTLVLGLPVRGQATCGGDGNAAANATATAPATPSCCLVDCHCGHAVDAAAACDCGDQRAPAPEPAAPAPHQEPATTPEPLALPAFAVPAPASAPRLRAAAGLPIGLLPHVSRQKALSVWSC